VEETGKLVIFGILKPFHLLKNKEWLARSPASAARSISGAGNWAKSRRPATQARTCSLFTVDCGPRTIGAMIVTSFSAS